MNALIFASLALHQWFYAAPAQKPQLCNVTANSLSYAVYYEAKKVGSLSANRSVKGNVINYSLSSNVKVNVVKEYNIIEKINEEFKEDKLQSSIHTRHVNSAEKANNKAIRYKTCYKLTGDKHTDSLSAWILQTTLTLYFHEPTDKQEIYSQNYRKLITIKKVKEGLYELPLPNGKKAKYHYKAGKLIMLESSSFFGDVKFVLE